MHIRARRTILLIFFTTYCLPLSAKKFDIDSLFQISTDLSLSAIEKAQKYDNLGQKFENDYQVANASQAYAYAVKFYREAHNNDKLPELLFRYASMSCYTGNYVEGIDALLEVIKMLEKRPNEILLAQTYMQLGLIYYFEGNFNEALSFYKKALKIAKKEKDNKGISIAYNNIANIYQKKKEFAKANLYYSKALKIQRANADSSSMDNCLMNIGTNFIDQNKIENAYKPLMEALKISTEIGDIEVQALTYSQLALYYSWINDYKKVEDMLSFGEKLSYEAGYDEVRLSILQNASSIYAKSNQYSLAYSYLKKSNLLADSITNKRLKEKAMLFEKRFKSKERETELALKNQKLQAAAKLRIAFIIIFFLMSIIILSLVFLSQKRYRQNKKLQEINDMRTKLLSIISHDIKSPAIAQKMALEALLSSSENYDSTTKKILSSIRDSIISELSLLKNLLDWGNIEQKNYKFKPEPFNLIENIEKSIKLISISAKNKDITLKLDTPPHCIVKADRQMINTVIRNLLSNAVKFSPKGQIVSIQVNEESPNKVKVSIADQGEGISKQQLENLFKFGKNEIKAGTNGEMGSGLGLIICKKFLKRNNSKLIIESKEGEGSIFSFILPSVA